MNARFVVLCLILSLCPVLCAQNPTQAALLEKAYQDSSKALLYSFFDNWSEEVTSNEAEASNLWVAEAHKVFAAFYQPLQLDKIGCTNYERNFSYKDYPYLIVQDTLYRIYEADSLPYRPEELEAYYADRIFHMCPDDSIRTKELGYLHRMAENNRLYANFIAKEYSRSWMSIPMTTVDSNISFRPPVSIAGKKVVHLSKAYAHLLDSFLGDEHTDWGTHSIMQPAYAEKDSRRRMEFLGQAAKIFYGHWGGYWQYETYPKATSIIFDSKLQRAVVYFRFVYEGGEVFLEKQGDRWTVVSGKLTWIE